MPNILEVRDLHVRYGSVDALTGVSLDVGAGEVVTVLGANGAGKSSLLNAIAGLVRSSSGTVTYDGKSITGWAAEKTARAGVSLVPEGRRIFTRLSVHENLILGGYYVQGKEFDDRAEEMYGLFPVLQTRRTSFAGYLSGGEQQMLAIARSLMSAPRLLLLDEPSAGLSPIATGVVYGALREYSRRTSATILLVEQNVQYALGLASRGYVLELGNIKLSENAAELQKDERVTDLYLGEGDETNEQTE